MAKVSSEGAEVNARIVYWGIEGAAVSWAIFNVGYFFVVPHLTHRYVLKGHALRWFVSDTLPFMFVALGECLDDAADVLGAGPAEHRQREDLRAHQLDVAEVEVERDGVQA